MMTSLPDGRTWAQMSQKPIELILLRELASRLTMAVSLFDADGRLVYLNEPAEELFAMLFDEVGEISQVEFMAMLRPTDDDGAPIPAAQMPSGLALSGRGPQHCTMSVCDTRGGAHRIALTVLPLDAQGGGTIGAMSIFWEKPGGGEMPFAVP
jgi:hypothetical protein